MSTPDWTVTESRRDADRVSDALNARERREAEEARLAAEFKRYVLAGDIDICIHGNTTTDREPSGKYVTGRPQALWETMWATADYRVLDRIVMRALALLARKGEIEATEALDAMARMYGQQQAEVD